MIRNYIICATPRSGSNVLCEVLSSLGYAGRPFEHLWDPPGTQLEPLADRWPRVLEAGRGPNGVFATKLMWYQAERLERELPGVLGLSVESLPQVLAATLSDPIYVYLTRRDRVRQAISLMRAEQTGQWRSMDHAAWQPYYDADAITRSLQFLARDEANWEDFFTCHAIVPYRLTYEQFDGDPEGAVAALLAHLGYDGSSPISLPEAVHRRQADHLTEEWARRYSEEESDRCDGQDIG